ncbi:LRR receptor-like serine/threonine-protein kinase EFR isoform X2 [Capsicum annuum]|nr:LRR receptor-like serine/threonine-protein kinase EFR isoform X2 [Capsicum annuum]
MPTSLSNCSQLQLLSLSVNEFDGPIYSEIGRLSNLQKLYLGYNHFTGIIPQEIGNLLNLVDLRMESNKITGSVPISIFNISSLQILLLSRNNLKGYLPREIGNLTKTQLLQLNENNLRGEIPEEISKLMMLKILDLEFNSFSCQLDMDIFNISGLRVISLSNNNLSGSLSPNMCSILPNIEGLFLAFTNLVGTIPHSLSNCSKHTILELSRNKLTGLIPKSLGYLTHLQILNLVGNNLRSDSSLSLLTSLTNNRNLTALYLSLNPLNGMLPSSMGNLSTSFIKLYAKNSKIEGPIPNEVGNLSSLLDLDLSGNNLVGLIPSSIGNLRGLQRINLSSNKFTGFIGDHICKLQHLGAIYFSQNQLSGSLPHCLGNVTSLREIHLSSNKLSSNIPPRLGNLQDLVVHDLSSNNMVGSLPQEIGNLKAVTKMDLSMNQFSNEIPREITGLQTLAYLSLRHNNLQGAIPDSMSNMVGLEFLDLSHNNISGIIPMSLVKLQYLKYFNVSDNQLYGEIPSGGPFKKLSSQFFIYNEALCGSSRFNVPPCPTSSKNRSNREKMLVLFLLLSIAVVFPPLTFVLLWIRYRRGKSAPQQANSLSTVAIERISYYEILRATNALSESNLIGSGSFGSVYQGVLRSGTIIAVKVFNLQLDAALKSFDSECEVLRSLRHRNLVKVITSCSNLDFKALVLDYMPNGSLEKHLYSHNYFFDIRRRLSIMMDVACALEYLHHGCSLPVIHCDVKPSNVLLDEYMVAHLSDFGISKLLGEDQGDLYTKTFATLGYIAPEYGLDGLVSTKCDVYSYGVMLLETFTRRKPTEFEGDLSLKQ